MKRWQLVPQIRSFAIFLQVIERKGMTFLVPQRALKTKRLPCSTAGGPTALLHHACFITLTSSRVTS
jgi:hypothetical protein